MSTALQDPIDSAASGTPPPSVDLSRQLELELRTTLYEKAGSWRETLVEKGIFVVSLTAIFAILLIFIFVARECLPLILGRVDTARSAELITPEKAVTLSSEELATYLNQPVDKIRPLGPDVLKDLVASRNEELSARPNPDTKLNTVSWPLMLLPYRWQEYTKPEFIWQPTSLVEKYNLVPLFFGSVKIAVLSLLMAVPLALMAAIYVSQLASGTVREVVKPVIELLAGIPSVVLGFLALIALASLFQWMFGYEVRLNTFVASVALALALIPVIFTIAEDALSAVPQTHKDAARAMGATEWHATVRVMVPAAFPGIFAAVILGFGRAIGETMVVLMASGNASILNLSIFQSCRTATAAIAAELADAPVDSPHYRVLFLIGFILFVITFVGNVFADIILQRLRARLEGQQRDTAPDHTAHAITPEARS